MPVDPQAVFCPNPDCPARGQHQAGSIGIHSRKERRYHCHICNKTFAESKGTPFYSLHTAKEVVVLVVTLLAYGCPVRAIVWMAMAVQVSTRLWLGGVVSSQRDMALITALIQQVRRCALCRPLLFCVDGFRAYVQAIGRTFREPLRTGQRGRPRLRPWDGICIAQVVKQYERRRVVGIVRRVVQGTMTQIVALLAQTQGSGQINTAYSERLNATFRSRLATLVRKGRSLARQVTTLQHGMCLVGTVYNFCTEHQSLRLPGLIGGHKWLARTPAMATGITDRRWRVEELLMFHVPLPPWRPPRRRGPPSKATQWLAARWCT